MSAIGKIQASLAQATQETTLALASANFDFSLIKIEAPAEYRELGLALPAKKRSEAEDGTSHVTARRLGSLFHSILPETPRLIEAYGHRASEIARSLATTPEAAEAYGPLKEYVGFDGTSIWAAATSGPPAIACHLLACMLACAWPADEATAIWLEIVTERKRQIEEKVNSADFFNLNEAVSCKLSFEKDQLARWDNSARAWLAAASDSPPVRSRQKVVRGLLNKVNGVVPSKQDVYTSVIEAWKVALQTFENLIRGMSCGVSEGAVLVALTAWHLYPDLILPSPKMQEFRQHDLLVQPAQVTIGLKGHGQSPDDNGVHWSLSLAHLRYYGPGEITSRSLKSTPSGDHRFQIDEFILVVIGACIGQWSTVETITLEFAIDFLVSVIKRFDEVLSESKRIEHSWVRLLNDSLAVFEDGRQEDRDHAKKLMALGWRNKTFVSEVAPNQPALGLASFRFHAVLSNSEDQDAYERDLIQDFITGQDHRRQPRCLLFLLLGSEHEVSSTTMIFYSDHNPRLKSPQHRGQGWEIKERRSDGGYVIVQETRALFRSHTHTHVSWDAPPPFARIMRKQERLCGKILRGARTGPDSTKYTMHHCGSTRSHGVYLLLGRAQTVMPCLPTPRFREYISLKPLDSNGLFKFLAMDTFSLFKFLVAAHTLYADLPGVTVSPSVLNQRLPRSLIRVPLRVDWGTQLLESSTPSKPGLQFLYDQDSAFRILVLLHTGHDVKIDNEYEMYEDNLAVSIEDTLFIDPRIISNPSLNMPPGLRHVRGNLGVPGVALIRWHAEAYFYEVKKPDSGKWPIINHHPFDGRLEDSFRETSLHLRLTGYSEDIDFGQHNQVSNGAILDAVVSAFDHGEWIGDIHILEAIRSLADPPDITTATRISQPVMVQRRPGCLSHNTGEPPPEDMVAIENWEELLSPPPSMPGVVKCHGNWQARLTALALCNQLGYAAFQFGDHGCWGCALETKNLLLSNGSDADSDGPQSSGEESDGRDDAEAVSGDGHTDADDKDIAADETDSESSYSSGSDSIIGSKGDNSHPKAIIFIL